MTADASNDKPSAEGRMDALFCAECYKPHYACECASLAYESLECLGDECGYKSPLVLLTLREAEKLVGREVSTVPVQIDSLCPSCSDTRLSGQLIIRGDGDRVCEE